MQKQIVIWMLALSLIAVMAVSAEAQQWAIKADYAESCSCNTTCPCHFGTSPTMENCEANGLLEIKKGNYGDVSLDGISVVYSGRTMKWARYYVSENATDKQVKAVKPLMAEIIGFLADTKVLSTERVPVSVERTATKVKFSVPASTVEIEVMKGRDGKPIKIENLPAPYLMGCTQYKSVTNSHHSKDKEFSYSGTNGLTSKVDLSSKK